MSHKANGISPLLMCPTVRALQVNFLLFNGFIFYLFHPLVLHIAIIVALLCALPANKTTVVSRNTVLIKLNTLNA